MTDAEYFERQFNKDCMEKKRTARGDRSRKRRGGRFVRMPSDGLTKKEVARMSGEVKTYNMNKPMNWQELRAMPEDLRVQYIVSLRERFGLPNRTMAELFGVKYATLSKSLERWKVPHSKRGAYKFNQALYEKWLAGEVGVINISVREPDDYPFSESSIDEIEIKSAEEIKEESVKEAIPESVIVNDSNGSDIDLKELSSLLMSLKSQGIKANVSISFSI